MRFYLKLFVLISLFACASRWQLWQTIDDLAYDARVAFVCAFGSVSDYEALIDDTERMLACEHGNPDLYVRGKRYRQLLAERLAAAARLKIQLSEDDFDRIRAECAMEAFGPVDDLPATNIEKESTVSAAGEDDNAR
jgi:hypothetical protein